MSMADSRSLVEASNLFQSLASVHPGVEVWADAEFHDGGFDHFWICSNADALVRNLAYVRVKAGAIETRTYDQNGDELWVTAP